MTYGLGTAGTVARPRRTRVVPPHDRATSTTAARTETAMLPDREPEGS